jgi:hypothetical protein
MPQVPVYNGPQIREQALQGGFQQNVDVGRSARAMGQALTQVGEVADRVVMREAETKANNTDTEIASGWLQWDAENRKKYQGANAGEYSAAAEQWWAKAAESYGKDFDPLAKSMVNKTLVRRKAASLGQVTQFVEAEKEKHADETAAANIGTTIQFGVTSGDVVGASARVRELSAQVGARKGWTTEQVQAEQSKNLSALHLAQISKLAEQDPVKAQAYYDANKAEVGFAQQPRVEEILRKEVDNQFATQFAAEQAGKPLSEQLKATAEIKDPARREKALIEVKNNYALVQQAQAEQEKKFSDAAWQLVGQGKRVPEAILASMDGKERVQLQEHLRAKAERGLAAPKTDPKDHARLIDMMLNDPEGFKKERLAAARLSPTDLEQFATKQQAMRNPTGGAKQDSILTDDQRVNGALTVAGVDPKKNPNAAYQVRTEIDRRVRADSLAKGGKELTPDEKQKHIDAVLMDKVFVSEFGRDPQKPLALLTPEEQKNAYVTVNGEEIKLSSIPLNDRMGITESLRRKGEPISEQAIAEVYARVKKSAAPVAPAAPATPAVRITPPTSFPTPSAGLRPPSPYAPAQEWAAYHAAQAQKNAKP